MKWYERFDKELITLGCVRSKLDTACYTYREEGQLAGMACIYVDDVIVAGNKIFNENVLCGLKDAFLIGKTEGGALRYVGTNIEQQGDRIVMNQDYYIDSIELIDLKRFAWMSNDDILDESGKALFRSKVGALNWLAVQTRPDIVYEVMELSTCFKKATVRNLKEVNKCIKMVKSMPGRIGLKFGIFELMFYEILVMHIHNSHLVYNFYDQAIKLFLRVLHVLCDFSSSFTCFM